LDIKINNDKNEDKIVVSTIHKAKGREYDLVVIADNGEFGDNGLKTVEEAKVYYVCMSRAKETIVKVAQETKNKIHKKNNRNYQITSLLGKYEIAGIEVGLEDDVNFDSFVKYDVHGDKSRVNKTQEYILKKICLGDQIQILVKNNAKGEICMHITHQGYVIGAMSNKFLFEYKTIMDKIHRTEKKYLFLNLKEVYIQDIISVVRVPETLDPEEIAEPYSNTGLWHGVLLSGFARPEID